METTVYFKNKEIENSRKNFVGIIGTFNPITSNHFELFESLKNYANDSLQNSLVVLLYPSPAQWLWGKESYPQYEEYEIVIQRILELGIDSVIHINFKNEDLDNDCCDFLNDIKKLVPLKELWLGQKQTL